MQRHQRKLLFPVGMSQFIPVCFLSPFPQHGSQQLQQQQQQSARRRQTSFSSSEVVSGTRFRSEKLSYLGDRAAKIGRSQQHLMTLRPKRQSVRNRQGRAPP